MSEQACVAILHGWSDKGESFTPLRDFLAANGFNSQDVFLGNYISLDDDVRVEDVAKRMNVVVEDLIGQGKLRTPFHLIVHSTGALVARQWILDRYLANKPAPVSRLVMLAPANFGSKLAAIGKSMIGRVARGLGNRLQTGQEMLNALELASPYQWRLTREDLLDPTVSAPNLAKGPYSSGDILPFVIVGSRAYASGLQQIVNERGSDGTVRVSAADLNPVGMTIDFTPLGKPPEVRVWGSRSLQQTPLAVLPERDHSEVTRPDRSGGAVGQYGARLGQLILEALRCKDSTEHADICKAWFELSEKTCRISGDDALREAVLGQDRPDDEQFHQYMQINVMVRDNYGNLLKDFFLEFSDPKMQGQQSTITFHKDVLDAVHVNSTHPAYRCLYMDRTDLIKIFYVKANQLAASISAAPPGRNVKYFDSKVDGAKGTVTVHAQDSAARDALGDQRLFRNRTHLIEVIVPRRPIDKVFSFLP